MDSFLLRYQSKTLSLRLPAIFMMKHDSDLLKQFMAEKLGACGCPYEVEGMQIKRHESGVVYRSYERLRYPLLQIFIQKGSGGRYVFTSDRYGLYGCTVETDRV